MEAIQIELRTNWKGKIIGDLVTITSVLIATVSVPKLARNWDDEIRNEIVVTTNVWTTFVATELAISKSIYY